MLGASYQFCNKTKKFDGLIRCNPKARDLPLVAYNFSKFRLNSNRRPRKSLEKILKEPFSVLMLCAPVFIFTSDSSALLGRPRCGLLIWLLLLECFHVTSSKSNFYTLHSRKLLLSYFLEVHKLTLHLKFWADMKFLSGVADIWIL